MRAIASERTANPNDFEGQPRPTDANDAEQSDRMGRRKVQNPEDAFGARMVKPSFDCLLAENSLFRPNLVHDIIRSAHDLFKHIEIFSEDFSDLIPRLDSLGTFFSCDPPYWKYGTCHEECSRRNLTGRLPSFCGQSRGSSCWATTIILTSRRSKRSDIGLRSCILLSREQDSPAARGKGKKQDPIQAKF